jgi:hypothetical protein
MDEAPPASYRPRDVRRTFGHWPRTSARLPHPGDASRMASFAGPTTRAGTRRSAAAGSRGWTPYTTTLVLPPLRRRPATPGRPLDPRRRPVRSSPHPQGRAPRQFMAIYAINSRAERSYRR